MSDYVAELFSLNQRVALVTGASSGIGRHIASVLARCHASVVLVARRENYLKEVGAQIRSGGGNAAEIAWDVSDVAKLDALASEASQLFGPPTIVVNAAGSNPRQPAETVSIETWNDTLSLNLSAPFFLTRALVPGMREAGQGNIVNVASLQTRRAFPNGVAYGAAKAGLGQLTRAMAEAWSAKESGIVANALAPGFFPTDLTAPVFEDEAAAKHHAAMTCIGRNGRMPDLDGALIFLASRACAYITGQIIPVDGGYTAK